MTSNTTLSSLTDDETATATVATDRTITADATAGEHRTRHDFESEGRLSTSVVTAVANALETDPLALDERLYDVLDPDALDNLFDGRRGGSGPRQIEFELADCLVTVYADGRIDVCRGA